MAFATNYIKESLSQLDKKTIRKDQYLHNTFQTKSNRIR